MTDNGLVPFSRRGVLKGLATASAVSIGTAYEGIRSVSASTRKIVVEQGDQRYEMAPLSTGESVKNFYDYRNAQSHTSTGIERERVSNLFFFEDDDGLSLVIIHDQPYNGSGGAVDFSFGGLPDEGSWIVHDDPGDFNNSRSSPPKYITWSWDESKTDGGVFKGGFDEVSEITLDPAFNEEASREPLSPGRIENWQVLSGDASEPTRYNLALDQPITIRVAKNEKSLERQLAETYAPKFGYDSTEPWYPTNPLNYTVERDGETVVDGITALNDYTREFKDSGIPPEPTVFYNVVGCEDSDKPLEEHQLIAVQYWRYYVFDQFLNFHWHDSEKFHVFIDTETMEPVIYVANAHLNWCPNNEFLDENSEIDSTLGILSELGAHASALDINNQDTTFERFSFSSGSKSDVTNGGDPEQLTDLYWMQFSLNDINKDSLRLPSYGLPRDENYGIDELFGQTDYQTPYLDGKPIYEDSRLPHVEEADIITGIHSKREHDVWFTPNETDNNSATVYNLRPLDDVEKVVDDFVGPGLEYFNRTLENPFANTIAIPWESRWYDDPVEVIYDITHRKWVRENYDIGVETNFNRLLTAVQQLSNSVEGRLREEYEESRKDLEELGERFEEVVTTTRDSITNRVIAAINSPETIPAPSSLGFIAANDISSGEHHLSILSRDHASYSEWFEVGEGGLYAAGADGNLLVTPETSAVKLTTHSDAHTVDHISITEDFAGDIYESRVPNEEKFETNIHSEGRYTLEITDQEGQTGVHRIAPDGNDGEIAIDGLETGSEPSINFLIQYLDETIDITETVIESNGSGNSQNNSKRSLTSKFESAINSLERALSKYQAGKERQAEKQLKAAKNGLNSAANQLESEDTKFDEGAKVILVDRTETSIYRCNKI